MKTNREHSKFREHRLVFQLPAGPESTHAPAEAPDNQDSKPQEGIERSNDVPRVADSKQAQATILAQQTAQKIERNTAIEEKAAKSAVDAPTTSLEEEGGEVATDVVEAVAKGADTNQLGGAPSPNASNAPAPTPYAKIVNSPATPKAPKEDKETRKGGAEKAPETIGDQLFKLLDDAGEESAKAAEKMQKAQKKLEEAGDDPEKKSAAEADIREAQNEQFKAFAKSFAAVLAIFKSVFDGSFSKKAGKTETGTGNAPNQTAGENSLSSQPSGTPAQIVQREVAQRNPRNAAETQRALTKTREEKEKSMESNTKAIDSLIVKRETIEDGSKALIDQKGEVQKQLIELKEEDGQENAIFELETELERIKGQITANEKAINKINKRIDDLQKKNENLKKEITAATNIEKDLEEVVKRLTPFMEQLAKMNGLAKGKITITLDSNGIPVITIDINGADNATSTQVAALGIHDTETGIVNINENTIAVNVPEKLSHAKDAPVGQIRKDTEGNYWIKQEDSMWGSYHDSAKNMTSDSGFKNTKWGDSLMDERTAEIVKTHAEAEPPAAPAKPAETPINKVSTENEQPEATTPEAVVAPETKATSPEPASMARTEAPSDEPAIGKEQAPQLARTPRVNPGIQIATNAETPQANEQSEILKRKTEWAQDINRRAKEKKFDITARLKGDRFILSGKPEDLKKIIQSANGRGMNPQINEDDRSVSIDITKFVEAENTHYPELTGYRGPNYSTKSIEWYHNHNQPYEPLSDGPNEDTPQ